MDAHTTEAFGRRLLAQFGRYKTSLRKTKAAARAAELRHEVDALTAAIAAQQARAKGARDAATLDPVVDATWGALVLFLEAWSRLHWRDEGKTAQAILDVVFTDRLEFTQRKYAQQWSEANARLHQLHARPAGQRTRATLAAQIEELGGAILLEEIADKHTRFGKALGLTDATDAPESVDVRSPLDAMLGAAKDYVAAVMQLDDRDVDDVETVRHELLFVIDEFDSASNRAKPEGEAKPTPAPAPEPKG